MNAADKVSVIDPIDALVVYGNDGRVYQSQGCSILGLLEFRRWNRVFLREVEKIGKVVEDQPLFANAKFLDFYSLSLGWEDPDSFVDVFPYWADWAEEEAIAAHVPEDDQGYWIDVKLSEWVNAALESCQKFDFQGPTLAIACNQMLELNGLDAALLTPKTLYQLLFDHVGPDGSLQPGRLIALNKPESYKRPGAKEKSPEPPSDIDPTYQAIAGLASITEDLEKALSIAQNYPAKLVNGVGAAIAEQQERQRAKSGSPLPRKLSQDELKDVLAGFSAPL